ncbi:(E)-4-hydroxy-3-methylbut-2-enyl-diphosphate synthase [Candidatus Neptunochlamydia vexilliferae]|uniref:4-hydroxy-3-methylbut-2-en-1-yl diphosphate synthase (flavodoxin) n=1 Tax=Candidatus Neptunichlamydia vexilliferae TaxID=1651774 RepID=A0ABS0B0L5_9BACT|nr:(E)-4-hydroxy-3-methylbut-2-enyl-diphosphate synthase [Candidatus Neptunochlamydia vexilliferae]MBF5059938.1 4-hydroxy-3-methylbut-2-en-1-yl diphosphate synthase (flavodoxin) [Candidatus Neptunochlamydia vexilliferae]
MKKYSESVYKTKRWKTRKVMVGNMGVGGDNPIRIQSMTTSSTRDVEATVDQIIRLADMGCEIARVTVQGKKEAEACEAIKNTLVQKGYTIPLVADIHFYPPAAMLVAEYVDKVRVNPGNFVDKRATFKTIEYDDATYAAEIEKIFETFGPLVEKCKKLGRAIRIGTNHGSLSDRIMNRYGDTPFGMVESALEFARVCRQLGYHDFIFSMKASNPLVMMKAYRLLVAEMMKLGWNYPLHLGVTEAGDGEDGRVKSAIGTGSLLLEGLGDTIRVSLTEDPWLEVDPCKRLIDFAKSYEGKGIAPFIETKRNIQEMKRRFVRQVAPLQRDGSVLVWGEPQEDIKADAFFNGTEIIADGETFTDFAYIKDGDPSTWKTLLEEPASFILLELTDSLLHQGRYFFEWIQEAKLDLPVILVGNYPLSEEDTVIHAAAEMGALLADGMGEGILLKTNLSPDKASSLSFNILQGCRMRATKTEFIACPSCGRTLFDLQEVTQKIRAKTAHLPGVKIAIMGCIVNGPGEMADADFGYVGSGREKIDLYVGKECVERNIHYTEAVDRLVQLIKDYDRWIEPEEAALTSSSLE